MARWPIVELASSMNLPLTKLKSLLLELEIKINKTYKSWSKLGCHEYLRPLEFFFFKKRLVFLLVSRFVLWSRNVHRQQPERSEIVTFSGLSLARFKTTADILIVFAGEFFTEEIEDTESLYCAN